MTPAPPLWQYFLTYMRMPDALGQTWWHALCQARWSEAIELRQAFQLHAAVRLDSYGLVHRLATPVHLARILENLVSEHVLTLRTSNSILHYQTLSQH